MNTETTVHIAGLGGVGFWVAAGLSRTEIINIKAYDDDNLTGGFGHSRLPMALPTTMKGDLLKGFLRTSIGGQVPEIILKRFTGKEVGEGDLVVDCTDAELDARKKFWRAAKRRGARCIRVSYDGSNGIVVVAEGLPFATAAPGGYRNVPSFALSLAAGGIGAEVVHNILRTNHTGYIEFQVTLSALAGFEVQEAA